VRIVFVLLLFITFGSVCIAYLILMLILPTSPQNSADSYVQRMNDKLKK
jgi:phage shock protein PspC (stress-responsive transcriptional regulator)